MAIIAVLILIPAIIETVIFGINLTIYTTFYLMYFIARWILLGIDFCQTVVRRFCGLDGGVSLDPNTPADGEDIVFALVQNDAIRTAFLTILITCAVMVIFFTMLQIIRSEYTTEGSKNAKGPIIKTALKSLFLFGLIPVASMLGIVLCNDLLFIVDKATTSDSKASLAGLIFVSAAEDANTYRRAARGDDKAVEWVLDPVAVTGTGAVSIALAGYLGDNVYDSEYGVMHGHYGYCKVYIDKNGQIKGSERVLGGEMIPTTEEGAKILDGYFKRLSTAVLDEDKDARPRVVQKTNTVLTLFDGEVVSYTNTRAVIYFYNLTNINYIFLFAGGWFALKAVWTTMFGVIMRMYRLAVLFVISPFPVSLSVLDNGQALNKWKQLFISNLFSAYGVTVALNLIFTIIPIVDKITVFSGVWYAGLFNIVVRMIIVIVGCMMIKDIAGMMSGFFGGGNAMDEGEGMAKQVGDTAMAGVKAAATVAAVVGTAGAGAAALGAGAAKFAGKFAGKAGAKIAKSQVAKKAGAKAKKAGAWVKDKAGALGNKLKNSAPGQWVQNTAETVGNKVGEWGGSIRNAAGNLVTSVGNVDISGFLGAAPGTTIGSVAKAGVKMAKKTGRTLKKAGAGLKKSFIETRNDLEEDGTYAKTRDRMMFSGQVFKTMAQSSKLYQTVKAGSFGLIDSGDRAKIRQAAAGEDPYKKAIQSEADKARTKYVEVDDGTGLKRQVERGKGLLGKKDAGYHVRSEQRAKEKELLEGLNYDSIEDLNRAVANMDYVLTKFARGEGADLTRVEIENAAVTLRETSKGAKTEQQGEDMNDFADILDNALKHEKGTGAFADFGRQLANSMESRGYSKDSLAGKTVNLADDAKVKIDMDPSALTKFKDLAKNTGLIQALNDPNINKNFRLMITKAHEAATQKFQNQKIDPKSGNKTEELLRQLISEVQKLK
ncbi:MAG: hypothetical protein IJA61_00820 [Clostridia bacterium]|nr:hypothetical protein [Clostridia bacterium]